jgi:hypothetical protein
LHLLNKLSTTWSMHCPQFLFALDFFHLGSYAVTWSVLKLWSSYLCLLHSWDYSHEPPCPPFFCSFLGHLSWIKLHSPKDTLKS